jgi:hypothetical protein
VVGGGADSSASWAWTKNAIFLRQAGRRGGHGAQQDFVNFLELTDPVRKTTKQNDALILKDPVRS